jgi:hypothetical protein
MEMNSTPLKEMLSELFTMLEALETQGAAVLLLMKDQEVTDQQLAPYLERSGNASNVKWRAARMRMEYLLSPVQKDATNEETSKGKEVEETNSRESRSQETKSQESQPQPNRSKEEDEFQENGSQAKKYDENKSEEQKSQKTKTENTSGEDLPGQSDGKNKDTHAEKDAEFTNEKKESSAK